MPSRPAFSVVEVLVALVIFSVAALGCAATLGLSARTNRLAVARREAVHAIEVRLATLSLLPCDSLSNGAANVDDVTVSWQASRAGNLVALVASAVHKGTTSTLRTERLCQ